MSRAARLCSNCLCCQDREIAKYLSQRELFEQHIISNNLQEWEKRCSRDAEKGQDFIGEYLQEQIQAIASSNIEDAKEA